MDSIATACFLRCLCPTPSRPCAHLVNIVIAILGRVSATPCKQGNKQPVVLLNVPVKGRWQEDAFKFNQSSNSCVPTIRYNCVRNCVRTTRYRASFSSKSHINPSLHSSCCPFTDTHLKHCAANYSSAGSHLYADDTGTRTNSGHSTPMKSCHVMGPRYPF
jgi:hypothetical protein